MTLAITLPDGQIKEVTAPESGLATVTLKDGTEIGVRPTILDSKPWTRVIVGIFRTPTANHPVELLGEDEVKTAGPAVTVARTRALDGTPRLHQERLELAKRRAVRRVRS